MDCPDCGSETVAFAAGEYADALPGQEPGAALCTRCLALHPVADPPDDPPDLQRVSDAFPADSGAAVPLAVLVGLLENLALYRSEIADLLAAVGALDADAGVESDLDLAGRRRQLEQLL